MTGSHALVDSRCGRCGSPSDARVLRCGACGAPVALRGEWDSAKHPRGKDGKWGAGTSLRQSPTGAAAAAAARGYGVDDSEVARHAIGSAVALLPAELQSQLTDVAVLTADNEKERRKQRQVVQARVYPGDPTIYVSHWGSAFEDAAKGKPVELAGALAHEAWHQAHGPDEAGAYDQQLSVLRSLKASKDLVRRIEYAKEMAVYTQQRERKHR